MLSIMWLNVYISIFKNNKYIFLFLFLYSFILLFTCSSFSPLYPYNDWSDVNIYYTIGKGINFNLIPYKDLFDHKGPVTFFIYAIGYFLTPDSYVGMYIVESFFLFVTLLIVYITSKLFLNRIYSLCATLIFPFFFLSFSMYGGAAEEFLMPFNALILLFFMFYFKYGKISSNRFFYILLGVSLSIIFFVKLNLILVWFLPLLFVVIRLLRSKNYNELLLFAGFSLFGFFLTLIPIFIYFYVNNALSDFFHAYIIVNKGYGRMNDISAIVRSLKATIGYFIHSVTALVPLILTILGLIYFLFKITREVIFDKCIFLFSYFLVFIYLYSVPFFFHYYYQGIIIFSVLFCISIGYIFQYKVVYNLKKYVLSAFAFFSIFIYSFQKDLFGYSVNNLITRNFNDSFIELFSDKIQMIDNPSLVCLGVDNGIALFTINKILPKTKFFFLPNLRYDIYPEMFETQISYIKTQSVDFLTVRKQSFFTEILLQNNYYPVVKYGDYWLFKANKIRNN